MARREVNLRGEQPEAAATEPAADTVRVYSLTGVGYTDRFGVTFLGPYADVPRETADAMLAFRPDVVRQDADGRDEIVPGDAVYALEAPAPKKNMDPDTGEVTGG